MKTYSELRAIGRQALQGKWGESIVALLPLVLIYLFVVGFSIALELVEDPSTTFTLITLFVYTPIALVSAICVYPLVFGFYTSMWHKVKGDDHRAISDLWSSFKRNFWSSIGFWFIYECIQAIVMIAYMLVALIIGLAIYFAAKYFDADIILFIVIGVCIIGAAVLAYIVQLTYCMTYFIKEENPHISIVNCMSESRELMRGHKWQLFVLELSFIGWILLAILTLGIGFLWLMPYMLTTQAAFYEEIKPQPIIDETIIIEEPTNE